MLTLRDGLFGVLLPALIGVALFFLGRREAKRGEAVAGSSTTNDASAAVPFALGFGFLLGFAALKGGPKLPPGEAVEWLFFAAASMALVSLVYQFVWRQQWVWIVAVAALLLATIIAITQPLVENSWSRTESIAWIAGCFFSAMVVAVGCSFAVRNERGFAIAAAQAIILSLGAAVLIMSGSQTYGQLAGTLPASLFPMVLLAILLRTNLIGPEPMPMFVLLFGGMLLCGHLYSELTLLNTFLLFFSPLGCWIGKPARIQKLKSWQRGTLQFLAMSVPSAIAFGLALAKFMADIANRSADGY
jgi:hypothetical protein